MREQPFSPCSTENSVGCYLLLMRFQLAENFSICFHCSRKTHTIKIRLEWTTSYKHRGHPQKATQELIPPEESQAKFKLHRLRGRNEQWERGYGGEEEGNSCGEVGWRERHGEKKRKRKCENTDWAATAYWHFDFDLVLIKSVCILVPKHKLFGHNS